MAHFAKLDENNKVIRVTVLHNNVITDENGGEQESLGINFLRKLHKDGSAVWKQTSYNTNKGIHSLGGTPLRKNYAAKGMTYDESRDAFISEQPFDSWILNEATCQWDPPTPYPDDGRRTEADLLKLYEWNEDTLSWVLLD
jgi:hypothetical protein